MLGRLWGMGGVATWSHNDGVSFCLWPKQQNSFFSIHPTPHNFIFSLSLPPRSAHNEEMRRFTGSAHSSSSSSSSSGNKHTPVDLFIDDAPVYFIGPANRDNPMSQVRTRLMGKVVFNDPKIKWNRITLQFTGKAGLDINAPLSQLPRELAGNADLQEGGTMKLQSTMPLCDVEKELIFTGEKEIEFGLHLPTHLPPSIRTENAFVEYTLVANFSAGTFFKKYRIQKAVKVNRHYLPSPSAVIPCVEYNDARGWFEWSADVPKAVATEAGEIVVALRWSIEKELVEIDRIELSLEEVQTYRQDKSDCTYKDINLMCHSFAV